MFQSSFVNTLVSLNPELEIDVKSENASYAKIWMEITEMKCCKFHSRREKADAWIWTHYMESTFLNQTSKELFF